MGDANRYKADRSHPLIDLDPNKCILCGRCVRTCNDVVGLSCYGFINRGFATVVRPALGGSLLETDCVSCGLCISTCPTGAIAQKSHLAKPGPWRTNAVPTICHYCGVGCNLNYAVYGDTLIEATRREGDNPTHGNHCRKGRFGFHHILAPDRLTTAKIRAGRELEDTTLSDAIDFAASRIRELTRRFSGAEMAVFVSPRLTNEAAYLAQKLARIGLGTHNVTSLAQLVNRDLFCPDVLSTVRYRELEDAQVILAVNSNLEQDHFVVDLLSKRALRKGGKLIYIGPEEARLAGLSDVLLQCKPGYQTTVMLAILRDKISPGCKA